MGNKKIPAVCLSGGVLSDFGGPEEVVEYRIWVHGKEDTYYKSKTLKGILKKFKSLKGKEPFIEIPLAVVFDKNFKGYREVQIDSSPELKKASLEYEKNLEVFQGSLGSHGSIKKASNLINLGN